MQATLGFGLALPPSCALPSIAVAALCRRVPIANTFVALAQESVAWDVVLRVVCLNLCKGPCEEGVEFVESRRIFKLEWLEGSPSRALCRSPASNNRLDIELSVCTLSRLDLRREQSAVCQRDRLIVLDVP